MKSMKELPSYVVINDPQSGNKEVLRNKSIEVSFPLSRKSKKIMETLAKKYDQEQNCAGLAAPQIGFDQSIIIFAADDPEIKAFRPDMIDTMGRTIWINPSYEPIGDEKTEDYEGCFSVKDLAGPVKRFKTIKYKAYTPDGKLVTGIANGYLARVIQHEVDHLNGKLFIDYVPRDRLIYLKTELKQEKKN
jgi:peptide deformylase